MIRTTSGFGRAIALGLAWTLGAVAVASCGNGDDDANNGDHGGNADGGTVPPASGTIGSAGGTVSASDGTSVTIPAGALGASTTITVTPSPGSPLGSTFTPVGPTYLMGPEGLQFASAVTVKLDVTPALIPVGKAEGDVLVFTAPQGSIAFTSLPTSIGDATHVTAPTTHFSLFVPGVPNGATSDGGPPLSGTDGGSDAGGDGGEGGITTLPDGGVVDTIPTPNETAGSRLHPMYKRAIFADGAVTLARAAMLDTQRQEPCDSAQLSDGNLYCAPSGTLATLRPDQYFTDAACTAPMVGAESTYVPPVCADVAVPQPNRYFVTTTDDACFVTSERLFALPPATGRIMASTVYYLNGGICTATAFSPDNSEAYPLSATTEVKPADLVALTRTQPTETGTGRLAAAPVVLTGSDGSRWAADGQLVDTQTGAFCTVWNAADKLLRCLPTSGGYAYYADQYADSACHTVAYPVGSAITCPNDARYQATYGYSGGYDSDICFDRNIASLAADTVTTTVYQSSGAACIPVAATAGLNYWTGPTPTYLDPTTFVATTQSPREASSYGVDGTRVHPENVHTTGGDGSDVAALAVSAVDTQYQLACTPLVLGDDQTHCVPPFRDFQPNFAPTSTPPGGYLDAACTEPIVHVTAPTEDCARTRGPLLYAANGATDANLCAEATMYTTTAAPIPTTSMYYYKSGATCVQNTTTVAPNTWRASDMVKVDPSMFVGESIALETR